MSYPHLHTECQEHHLLVRDFGPPMNRLPVRPVIVCLCGSTRFKAAFVDWNARLTERGYIVLSVGLCGQSQNVNPEPELKKRLDELHLRKIDVADEVFVMDVGGYVGESTVAEVKYATELGKPVRLLSQEQPDYKLPGEEAQASLRQQIEISENDDLRSMARVRDRRESTLELLRRVEWLPADPSFEIRNDEVMTCPICLGHQPRHFEGCELALALGFAGVASRPSWWPPDPRCFDAAENGRLAGLEEAQKIVEEEPVHLAGDNFMETLDNRIKGLRGRLEAGNRQKWPTEPLPVIPCGKVERTAMLSVRVLGIPAGEQTPVDLIPVANPIAAYRVLVGADDVALVPVVPGQYQIKVNYEDRGSFGVMPNAATDVSVSFESADRQNTQVNSGEGCSTSSLMAQTWTADHQPAVGAVVELLDARTELRLHRPVEESGFAMFPILMPGHYHVRVGDHELLEVDCPAGVNVSIDLHLKEEHHHDPRTK